MKTLVALFAILIMPFAAFSGDFGISGGFGKGSLSNTGLEGSNASIETSIGWSLGLTYDFEGNRNYLKLGVTNQLADLTVFGNNGNATADVNIWFYEFTGNYYFFQFSEGLNFYGVINIGLANMEAVGQTTDSKIFLGVGGNLRYKAADKIYLSGALEYKKVLNDFALLYPSVNIEFKF